LFVIWDLLFGILRFFVLEFYVFGICLLRFLACYILIKEDGGQKYGGEHAPAQEHVRLVLRPEGAEKMGHDENNGQPQDAGHVRYGNGGGDDQDARQGFFTGDKGIGDAENEIGNQVADAAAGDGHLQQRVVQLDQPAVPEIGNAQQVDYFQRSTEGDVPRVVGQGFVEPFRYRGRGDQKKDRKGRMPEHAPAENREHQSGQQDDEADEAQLEWAQAENRQDQAGGDQHEAL